MNLVFNYFIVIFSLLIAGLIFRKIYKLSLSQNKSLNIFIISFIIIFVLSCLAVHFNRIAHSKIKDIQPMKGDKGIKGIKGEKGLPVKDCKCDEDACYRKVMSYITLVYNEWCVLTGNQPINIERQIRNKYIKQKVKMTCGSATFQELLFKNGSHKYPYYDFVNGFGNNLRPCNINTDCGAYDYLLNKWRQWILIILKYENGKFFLDSEDLTDSDFNTIGKNGMITEEDMQLNTANTFKIKNGDYVCDSTKPIDGEGAWVFENPLVFPVSGDLVTSEYKDKTLDIYIKKNIEKIDPENSAALYDELNKKKTNFFNLKNSNNASQSELKKAYREYVNEVSKYMVTLDYFVNYFVGNKIDDKVELFNEKKPLFKKNILFNSCFYKFYNTPGVPSARTKIISPFDEIRKFDAWYWGANPETKPKIIETCNIKGISSAHKFPKIKVKLSNNYKKVWDNQYIRQMKADIVENGRSVPQYFPYLNFGTPDVSIFEAQPLIDENEELMFKEFYPVGQIIIGSNYEKKNNNNCFPILSNNRNPQSNKNNGPKIVTLLVSGDVVSPEKFERIFIRKRTEGADVNNVGFSFWRPIPPPGYVALGDVISTNIGGAPPSLDSIKCIPKKCVIPVEYDNIVTSYGSLNSRTLPDNFPANTNNIIYDTDYKPSNQSGNYQQINIFSNLNSKIPSQKFKFRTFNKTKKRFVTSKEEKSMKFLESYNTFRVVPEGQSIIQSSNPDINSSNNIFYSINPEAVYEYIDEVESIPTTIYESQLEDSKYSILNAYDFKE